jgi:hypothetical protein
MEKPEEERQNCGREAGLAAVTGEHYEGGHWLGSFAVYLSRAETFQESETTTVILDSRHDPILRPLFRCTELEQPAKCDPASDLRLQ